MGKVLVFGHKSPDTDSVTSAIVMANLEKKLRKPQIGALYAIKSHFTVSNDEATIVMPTGTGKTETMLSYIVSEKIEKVLSSCGLDIKLRE